MSVLLRAHEIAKAYGPTPAVRDISIEVNEGEILAVTGPSGCGKSTLLHCLAGILRVDSGTVHYRDQDLTTWTEAARSKLRRSDFGVLFQFGQLVPELTAAENVALPLLLADTGRRAAREAALSWLDRFGVADLADKRPGAMSGGQQQRCAVARALITGPSVLFADEPTGALDALTGEQVLTQIVQVARQNDMSIVLVTHDARVAAYADREVVLRDGAVDPTGLGVGLGSGFGALDRKVTGGGSTDLGCYTSEPQCSATTPLDAQVWEDVNVPEVTLAVPVPLGDLVLLAGGTVAAMLVVVGVGLVFLRMSTDLEQLRVG
jgi:putative ABC transport system ATP-binding protein